MAVEDTQVRQLSLMLPREPPTLKFDLTIPASDLERFLALNGWPGDARAVSEQLHGFAPWQQRVQLNYVVNPPSARPPPLEVELCCTGPDEGSIEQRSELLRRLVASGLADGHKASALLGLLRPSSLVGAPSSALARNWYVKLRFKGHRPSAAKAYIGLSRPSIDDAPAVIEPAGASSVS
jgi:hypothetical protein